METSDWISNGISVVFLAFVLWELRLGRKQREREAIINFQQQTQTLHLEAMNDPDRLGWMAGSSAVNQKERRFWQLWINHIEAVYRQRNLFRPKHWHATLADFRDFFHLEGLASHWDSHQHLYSDDFRDFINREIVTKKAASPPIEPAA